MTTKQQLQDILADAIEQKQYEKAERTVNLMKQLDEIESFIDQNPAPKRTTTPSTSEELEKEKRKSTFIVHYIEQEDVLKFKRSPQTYTITMEFFEKFIEYLLSWKKESAFSSKNFYDIHANDLKPYTEYKASTLRQFITLLFRFCHEIGILSAPAIHHKNRYVVADGVDKQQMIDKVKTEKEFQF